MKQKNKIIQLVLFLGIFSISVNSFAQDPSFSQFFQYKLYLNPATTGSEKGLNVAMIYKNQWYQVPSGFNTYGFSADVQSRRISSGIGVMGYRDVAAKVITTNNIGISYAYIVRLSKSANLHIGIQASYTSKLLDVSKLVFSDQLDPLLGNINPTTSIISNNKVNFLDINTGALMRFKLGKGNFAVHNSIGAAVFHLTRPDESFQNIETKLPMRFTVHYGSMIPIKRGKYSREPSYFVSPVFKFDYQNKLRVYTLGVYNTFKPVYAGVMYQLNKIPTRNTHSMIFTGGIDYDISEAITMNVGYSYNLDFTGVSTKSNGQHEITVRFNFNNVAVGSPQAKKKYNLKCYDFPSKKAVKIF